MSTSILQTAERIFRLIDSGRCIAWVGSGLSRGAGYPGWPELLDHLCDACDVLPLSESDREKPTRLIDKAEECKQADRTTYQHVLADRFSAGTQTRDALLLLMQLPFKGYVTTNFDPLLDRAGRYGDHPFCVYPVLPLAALQNDSGPIYYIHGHAEVGNPPGSELVLARSDFEDAYQNEAKSFLSQLLPFYPVLFLGARLREPAIHEVFRRVHEIHVKMLERKPGVKLPQRRILLPSRYKDGESDPSQRIPDPEQELEEEEDFQEINIQIVRYEPGSCTIPLIHGYEPLFLA